MLNVNQKEKLKSNWGEKADAMACLAEVRIYDPLSLWECYIYALNPEDEDEIACIINGESLEVCDWKMSEINMMFNAEGEAPEIDKEYRPMMVNELYKKLVERI